VERASGGYLFLIRNRRFSLATTSTALSNGGYSAYAVATLWLSFQLSGDIAVVGAILFVESAIESITFVAGPTVDRARDIRWVLIGGYFVQGILAVVIGATLVLGLLTIPVLFVLVGAITLALDFTWTAGNAVVPRIVAREDLFRARGVADAVGGGNAIAGFAAGAGLLLVFGPAGAMFLFALLQVMAILAILPVSVPSDRTVTTRALADFKEGWRELRREPGKPLLQLAVFAGFQGFFVTAPPLLLTLLSELKFADPIRSYGILFTSLSVGSVTGGLLLGRWNPRKELTIVMCGGTAATAVLLLAATLAAPLLGPSIALWFLVGLANVAFWSAFLAYLQARVPSDRFGRVLTNLYFIRGVPTAIGATVLSLLATFWGPTNLALLVALSWVIIAAAGPALLPVLKGLEF